jgi:hypothetical protein
MSFSPQNLYPRTPDRAIIADAAKTVTYDFERQMEGATLRKCSEFADNNHQTHGVV